MERSLFLWSLLLVVLGGLFSLSTLAVGRTPRNGTDRLSAAAWAALAGILAAGSLAAYPLHHMYAHGHGPGIGFAIGGLGALLLIAVFNKVGTGKDTPVTTLTSFASAVVLTAALVPQIWFRHNLLDVQCGVMMGWVALVLLFVVLAPRVDDTNRCVPTMVASTGLLVTAISGMLIAEARAQLIFGNGITPVHWSTLIALGVAPIPAILAIVTMASRYAIRLPGAAAVAHLTSRWLVTDHSRALAVRLAAGASAGVLGLLIFRVLQQRAASHPPLFSLAATGVIAALVVHWLLAGSSRRDVPPNQSSLYRNACIAMLIVAAVCVSAYQRSAGFGMALVMVSAWTVALIQVASVGADSNWDADRALRMVTVLMAGTGIVVYRFMGVRFYEDLHWLSHTTHYQLFGLVTGMFGPLLAASLIAGTGDREDAAVGRLVLAGITGGLVGPFLAVAEIVIFGPKCCEGLVMGSVLACGIVAAVRLTENKDACSTAVTACAVLASLTGMIVLAQWMHALLPLALLSRSARAHMVLKGAALITILMLVQGVKLRTKGLPKGAGSKRP